VGIADGLAGLNGLHILAAVALVAALVAWQDAKAETGEKEDD